MADVDSFESRKVLKAFQLAWKATIQRYAERRVNSERCLQAYLFLYLNRKLPPEFRVFIEATIRVPTGMGDDEYRRIAIDTLICRNEAIYAAIEIKFSPKGQPRPGGVRKDVQSLYAIKNRRKKSNRVKVEMPRYRHEDDQPLGFTVHPSCLLIFAAFGKGEGKRLNQEAFWLAHRPADGYWAKRASLPKNFCVAFAHTNENGGAKAIFFGPPISRLDATERDRKRGDV